MLGRGTQKTKYLSRIERYRRYICRSHICPCLDYCVLGSALWPFWGDLLSFSSIK